MTRSKMAAALLMCCSVLSLPACNRPDHIATAIKPPAERLVCEAAGTRPNIPGEYKIDWTKVVTVDQAKAEHAKFVTSIRDREKVISGYILRIEGQLFVCSNNMTWLRDYNSKLPDPG